MRKVFFILITLTYTYIANAQVLDSNSFAIPIYSDTSSKLTNAKGWLLQNDGKWVNENNKIPNDKTVVHSKSDEYNNGKENFSSITLSTFIFKKTSYVLMVVKFTEGFYEFPNLKSNWKTNKAANFYVFEREKLRYLIPHESMFGKPFSVNLDVYCAGYINLDNDKLGINNIVTETIIKTNQKLLKNFTNLIFSIYPIKKEDKEKVLFKLTKTYTKKTLYEYYLQPSVQEQIFSKFYYETDYDDFEKFITDCLKASETFKKQVINFSKDNYDDVKELKSNYETIQKQFNSFNTSYESLNIDTSNFYAAPKISSFADTVAATSFIKQEKKGKKGSEKTKPNISTPKTDTLQKIKTDIINKIADTSKLSKPSEDIKDSIVKHSFTDTIVTNSNSFNTANPNINSENKAINDLQKVVLRVQIAGANDNNSEELYRQKFGISETIYVIPNGNMFKYAVGEFYSFQEAIDYKNVMVREFGVSGAFIIALENGKLISIAEARKKIKQ
jgi:hypothetical protein